MPVYLDNNATTRSLDSGTEGINPVIRGALAPQPVKRHLITSAEAACGVHKVDLLNWTKRRK